MNGGDDGKFGQRRYEWYSDDLSHFPWSPCGTIEETSFSYHKWLGYIPNRPTTAALISLAFCSISLYEKKNSIVAIS